MNDQEAVEPTPEEILELLEMFGGRALPIILSPEEEANLEAHMAYVERYGHQP